VNRRRGSTAALLGLAVLALAVVFSACGSGGEKTVTVTETVSAKPPKNGGGEEPGQKNGTKEEVAEGSGAIAGYVDFAKSESDSLVLTGWAASKDLSEPATLVVAEVGGETLAEAVPALKREDVVDALGEPGLLESGFELRLPLDSVECGTPAAGFTVSGSLDGKSSELSFAEGIKEAIAAAC
jgi:hypothetical protein